MRKLTKAEISLLCDFEAGLVAHCCSHVCNSIGKIELVGMVLGKFDRRTFLNFVQRGWLTGTTVYHYGIRWEVFEISDKGMEALNAQCSCQ